MTKHFKQMKGAEFIEKILAGERDFSGIELEEGFKLHNHKDFHKLRDYLRNINYGKGPINISESDFRYFQAMDICLRLLNSRKADLSHANLKGAKNLNKTINLETALFNRTRVTASEKKIIEEVLKKTNLFFLE